MLLVVQTKSSRTAVNTDHIVSITEDDDDNTCLIQMVSGATVSSSQPIDEILAAIGEESIAVVVAEPESEDDN